MIVPVDSSTCTSLGPCHALAAYLRDGVVIRHPLGSLYAGQMRLRDCAWCGVPLAPGMLATWDWRTLRAHARTDGTS
jgi:hypothetical protein